MFNKYLSDMEKAQLLLLVAENYTLVKISKRTGRYIRTIARVKFAAAGTAAGTISVHKKSILKRCRKTIKSTDHRYF